MWDSIRTNGLYQLQRYKMEGTAFEGACHPVRGDFLSSMAGICPIILEPFISCDGLSPNQGTFPIRLLKETQNDPRFY